MAACGGGEPAKPAAEAVDAGKVLPLVAVLAKRGVMLDADAPPAMALAGDGGKTYTLVNADGKNAVAASYSLRKSSAGYSLRLRASNGFRRL